MIQLNSEIHALGMDLIWLQDTAVPNRKASQNVKVEAAFADVSCPDMEVSRLFIPPRHWKKRRCDFGHLASGKSELDDCSRL